MSNEFCGNPFNHDAHSQERPDATSFWCDGVGRVEVKEEIVEKYDPSTMAEDGTEYSKVTIMIEDSKGVTIITAPRSSFPRASVAVQNHIPLDKSSENFYPNVDQVKFEFNPHKFGDEPGLKIERVVSDAVS